MGPLTCVCIHTGVTGCLLVPPIFAIGCPLLPDARAHLTPNSTHTTTAQLTLRTFSLARRWEAVEGQTAPDNNSSALPSPVMETNSPAGDRGVYVLKWWLGWNGRCSCGSAHMLGCCFLFHAILWMNNSPLRLPVPCLWRAVGGWLLPRYRMVTHHKYYGH